MAKVFLFGAGASCEYRGVFGGLFTDPTFFAALDEMWTRWLRSGAGLLLRPWDPQSPVIPGGAHHYDGNRWRLPDLLAILERHCGPDYRRQGLEATFAEVVEAGTPEEVDLFIRGIELTIFHKVRGLEAGNVDAHLRFLRHELRPGDAIFTFNYDPVLEVTLYILAGEGVIAWHEADGYGLELQEIGAASDPPAGRSTVELLKLHGSLNWLAPVGEPTRTPLRLLRITANSLRGVGQLVHTDEAGRVLRPVIVPPRRDKNYDEVGLTRLWQRAGQVLETASALSIIGYRIPETDAKALELLTHAARQTADATPVTYITRGDEDAIRRLQVLFPGAIIERGGFRAFVEARTPV